MALFNNATPFFSPPCRGIEWHSGCLGGRRFKQAKRYKNMWYLFRGISAIFFAGIFCGKSAGEVNFIYHFLACGRLYFLRLGMNLTKISRFTKKIASPRSRLIFSSRQKGGSRPSESSRRFREPANTTAPPPLYIHGCSTRVRMLHIRVISPRRFGRSDGAEKLSKAKLTRPRLGELSFRVSRSFARAGCVSSTRS